MPTALVRLAAALIAVAVGLALLAALTTAAHADDDSLGAVAGNAIQTVTHVPVNVCGNNIASDIPDVVDLLSFDAVNANGLCKETADDVEETGEAASGFVEHNLK
ncbi:chaplin family protein [Actinomadura fulvescens]|uniref:Chaplin domain-containing protein n=1 Tax=Actinomadura fulvescens TaxID=46160 RepID=A0ABN3QXF5_9ACTN